MLSVTSEAQMAQWHEENDEEIQQLQLKHGLYWRQAFDMRTFELSVRS